MYKIIISIIAGLLAGVATGFSGLSAATFISPILVSFLGINSFNAIGIALASDVLASFFSAITYAKNKNIDLKRGKYLFIFVVLFSLIGTAISYVFTSDPSRNEAMGYWLIISSMLLGIKMVVKPGEDKPKINLPKSFVITSILCGSYIGFVCGFQGTGGGLMMLFVLNIILGFEFKKAVGTSVTIMSITALVGAISHFVMANSIGDMTIFITCVVSTLIGAELSAIYANHANPIVVKRITGVLMALAGLITLTAKIII